MLLIIWSNFLFARIIFLLLTQVEPHFFKQNPLKSSNGCFNILCFGMITYFFKTLTVEEKLISFCEQKENVIKCLFVGFRIKYCNKWFQVFPIGKISFQPCTRRNISLKISSLKVTFNDSFCKFVCAFYCRFESDRKELFKMFYIFRNLHTSERPTWNNK